MANLSQPPVLASRWQANIGDHVIALAWSPDGATVAAASVSGPITLFHAADGKLKHQLQGHGFGTTALGWQPGAGKLLASAGQDGKVRLWSVSSGAELAQLDGESAWVERLAWNRRGDCLISAAGKKIRAWNEAGELLRTYPDLPATVNDIKWNAEGKQFVSGGYGGVTFWGPSDEKPKTTFAWKGSVLALAWSPDGKFLAGGGQDASVHFWYVKNGKDLEMSGYPRKVRELAWDSTSTYLATGGGNQVTVWNCTGKGPAGSTPLSFELHEQPLNVLAFQNRGPLLASSCSGGLLALWLPGGPKRPLAQTKLDAGISSIAWAPNDARLVVGEESGTLTMYAV